jgi:uncharacterized SAM-binding protein YcdF (DUF218 family)
MFFPRLFKASKWLVFVFLLWILFLAYQIATFPVGQLTDKADVAIVLGAAVYDDKPSPVFRERINHAVNLYKAGNIQTIIFIGGLGDGETHAESIVAKNLAVTLGIPETDILTEIESQTTRGNLLQAQKLVITKGLTSTLVVSDPLHSKRAMMMAEDIGLVAVKASATPTTRYQSVQTKAPFLLREVYFYLHYLVFNG